MEKIELRVEQCAGARLDKPWSAVFGLAGGTVGRGGQNKLILPDPEADVARVHAMVRLGTSEAYIANLCERRLIVVDSQEVRPGQEVPLALGACVGIGPYQIRVCALNQSDNPVPVAQTPAPQASMAAPAIAMLSAEAPLTATPAFDPPHGTPPAANASPFSIFTEPAVSVDSALLRRNEGSETSTPPTNAFDFQANPAPESGVRSTGRPLFIPDDFNPFEVVNRPVPNDEWGGLQAQSLAELAQQSHDGLIKALPLSGSMDDKLDNPAHSGLPKQLDPTQELDPLALFEQASMLAGPETAEIVAGRSSELSHVFHLPKAKDPAHPEFETSLGTAPAPPPLPEASAESLLAVQNVGLQTVQGLDLSLFGEGDSAPAAPSIFATPLPLVRPPHVAEPTAIFAPQMVAPTVQATPAATPDAALQAFGIALSGDVPAPSPTATPSAPQQTTAPNLSQAIPDAATPLAGNLEALSAAFLEGAGLTPDRAKFALTPEFMRAFGEAFRVAIEGSIDLLAARSEIKQEFRAGVTIIGSSANNPLKFLPNADGVIMQMVGQHFPGFMKPVPAIKEAFNDLRVHQLALMAGIRAAYSEALTRFDPLKMEELTPKSGLLDNLYGGARKAALWDEYKKNFSQLKNAAEDDMTAFSGQTFVQAYEQAASAAKGEA